eukprot:6197707-Pleurochrysis_carterae.AAC.2
MSGRERLQRLTPPRLRCRRCRTCHRARARPGCSPAGAAAHPKRTPIASMLVRLNVRMRIGAGVCAGMGADAGVGRRSGGHSVGAQPPSRARRGAGSVFVVPSKCHKRAPASGAKQANACARQAAHQSEARTPRDATGDGACVAAEKGRLEPHERRRKSRFSPCLDWRGHREERADLWAAARTLRAPPEPMMDSRRMAAM